MVKKDSMRYITIILFIIGFQFNANTQILIIPSDMSIKKPKMTLFGEVALLPSASQLVGGKLFHERNEFYSEMISENINSWFKQTYPNTKIYNSQDSLVNINKLKGAILREIPVYQSHHSKALFGSSGYKGVEGANTKYYLNILKEEYNVKYVVYVFANSIYHEDGLFFSTEFPEYAGHSYFYGVVLDTDTGYIEIIKDLKDKQRSRSVSTAPGFSNQKHVEKTPIFKKVDDNYIISRCKKLQAKLKRKIDKLE